ncbi:alpha/beta hydrolase [Spongisporangium articulatum]|uniref:Alpha/beta hydrolase n=1 Tax=Spongisporangium articulatum TaxID=3362603 RepID=A0ABW8AI37_9ACTN
MFDALVDAGLRTTGLVFPGAAREVTDPGLAPGEELVRTATAASGEEVALVTRPGPGHRATVFLYGNAMVMADTGPVRRVLGDDRATVVCVDYVGYGLSPGTPGEGGCYRAAHAAFDHAESLVGAGNVDVVGWSLGSAVALELATRRSPGRLVLLSPMSGVSGYVLSPLRLQGTPLRRLGPFAGVGRAARVRCDVLLVSGTDDRLTPTWMARDLAAQFERRPGLRTELMLVDGAQHNDLFSYPQVWRRTLSFLSS